MIKSNTRTKNNRANEKPREYIAINKINLFFIHTAKLK
ncbi:hypothetical protein P20480_2079 [Pseudoalteromonas sp. BSi20480]|nr:hypothetical protein P20480_2079 [Pseudoalteromonas sp. BSi20480]